MSSQAIATVVVTGGTKGLGQHLSLGYARRGCRVLSLYHADRDAAERCDEQFRDEGLSGRTFMHDVTADGSASGVWTLPEIVEAESLMLIHCAAAAFSPKPLHLLPWAEFQTHLDLALKGCWRSVSGLLRPMLALGGGSVVSVLSNALSGTPPKGFTAYRAAKAAQLSFTLSLSAEYAARGIRVLSVSPGFMHTGMTQDWHPSLVAAASSSTHSSDPSDVARHIQALVDDPTVSWLGENYDV